MSDAISTPRKSTITLGIKRLLNTAQFENLEVKLETTEEITWESLADRDSKIDKMNKLLDAKYIQVQQQVLADLGVAEKAAWRPARPAKKSNVGDELLA